MNKKVQIEALKASMQSVSPAKTAEQLYADAERVGVRTRRKSAIKLAQKDTGGLFEDVKPGKSKKSKSSGLIFSSHDKEVPPEVAARQYALDCLSRREYGTQELLNKMLLKDHPKAESEQVLKELTEEDLLSDVRFARAMVKHGYFKGQGPRKIMHDAQKKNLPAHYLNDAFAACEIDWFDLAKEVRIKKFGQAVPTEWKIKAKQMRFMQTRGFELDQINGSFKDK